MAITPWAKGQLSPSWTIPMVRDNGAQMDLTGVNASSQLSLVIYNANYIQTGTGAGTFAILETFPAMVRYTPASPDAATSGTFYVRIVVNFGGTAPDMSDFILWQVQN
jgi:hypothetical protein